MGWMLSMSVGTTAVESLNAAGNIFLGQTEAPLLIRPFIKDLTKYVFQVSIIYNDIKMFLLNLSKYLNL